MLVLNMLVFIIVVFELLLCTQMIDTVRFFCVFFIISFVS